MYVSTAKVLRQFAQKVASSTPELDKLQKAQLEAPAAKEPAIQQGPQEAPRTGLAGKSTDKYVNAIENATREPSMLHSALSGVDKAVDTGKALGNKATVDWQQNVNPYTVGAGGLGGAALLYAIAKMRQSEEDRKRGRQPILAPLLGGLGGAAAGPLLAGLMTRLGTSYKGPPLSGDLATMDATTPGGAGVFVPPNVNRVQTA